MRKKELSSLEQEIETLIDEMGYYPRNSDEYSQMANQLVKLYSLKETDSKRRITPDTLAIVAGNLLGIILIVGHERMNVVTSKALNFILKLR